MILRRLATAFRKQDWFTVFVETLIVVFGVFMGLQVNNWNEARQQSALGEAYLLRMTDDLVAMENYLEDKLAQSQANLDLAKTLLHAASAQDVQDDVLIAATEDYITDAWITPQFTIINAVYGDMSATGNLNLLDDSLRQQISTYYAGLERAKEVMGVNRDWSLPIDSQFIIEHDIYRWNRNFVGLSGANDEALKRETILAARDKLARVATLYIWIEGASVSICERNLQATRDLIVAVDGELGSAP